MKEQRNTDQACKIQIKSYVSQIFQEQGPSQELRLKQELLKRQIFDNYSHRQDILDQFYQHFIASALKIKQVKINQPDLGLFTIQQIRRLVFQFKELLKKNESKQEQLKQKEEKELYINIPQSFINEISTAKTFYKNGAWDYELMVNQMDCKRQKPYFQRQKHQVSIKFKNHSIKKNGGFFGIGSKLTLWIQLQSVFLQRKATVQRSIEDFIFLQKLLRTSFPHSFIPPLKISPQRLKQELKTNSESSNKRMITRCCNFLNQVTKRIELLQSSSMFAFITEEIYSNYILTRSNSIKININNFNNFKNYRGTVSVRVSQRSQQNKKQIVYKSSAFSKIWTNVDTLMTQSIKSSKELTEYLGNINDQINLLVEQTLIKQDAKKISQQCAPLAQMLNFTQDIIKMYQDIIKQSESFIFHFKDNIVANVKLNWNQFNHYKQKIIQNSENYQAKRKDFLEKQLIKAKLGQNNINSQSSNLKIGELNLEQNVDQQIWAQKQTAWYGYMNHEFISTFRAFLKRDRIQIGQQLKKSGLKIIASSEEALQLIEKSLKQYVKIDT